MDELQVGDCDVCGGTHSTELCPELGLNSAELVDTEISRARITLPYNVQAVNLENQEVGVFAQQLISGKSQFGPYEAKKTTHEFNDDGLFMLKIFTKDGSSVSLDTTDENECNWLCLIRAASNSEEQNCMAYQLGTSIFYNTMRDIQIGEELKVWYAPQYARKVGKPVVSDGISKVMLGMKVLYPTVDELPEVPTNYPPTADIPSIAFIPPKYDLAANMPVQEPSDDQGDSQENSRKEEEIASPAFPCKRCDQKYDTEIELANHIREHLFPLPSRRGRKPKNISLEGKRLKYQNFSSSLNLNRNENAKSQDSDEDMLTSDDEDEEEAIHDSEDEFSPKKVSKVESPNKRVMPRRSLRGVRTTGFEEYVVMTKSVAKRKRKVSIPSDGEENDEKHEVSIGNIMVVDKEKQTKHKMMRTDLMQENMDNNTNAEIKRKRGRPRKHQENGQASEKSELTKITPTDLDVEKNESTAESMSIKNDLLENEVVEGESKNEETINKSKAESKKFDTKENDENKQTEKENVKMKTNFKSDSSKENMEMKEGDVDNKNEKPFDVTQDSEIYMGDNSGSFSQTESNIKQSELNGATDNNELEEGHINPADLKGQGDNNVFCKKGSEKPLNETRYIISAATAEELVDGTPEKLIVIKTEESLTGPESMSQVAESSMTDTSSKLVTENLEKQDGEKSEQLVVKTKGLETLDDVLDIISNKEDMLTKDRVLGSEDELSVKNIGEVGEHEASMNQAIDESDTKETCDEKENDEIKINEGYEDTEIESVKNVKGVQMKPKGRKFKDRKKPIIPMIVRETNKGNKEYVCTICSKKFSTERYLRLHAPAHTDKFKCQYCGSRYTRKDSFEKHECKIQEYLSFEKKAPEDMENEDFEKEETIVRCKKCDISFETEDDGKRHVLEHHNANPFFCDWCQKSFSTQKHYKVHKCLSKSEEDKKYPCDICSQAFVSKKFLFRHMAMHTDIFKCISCKKRFSRKDSLQRHVLRCCPDNVDDYDLFVCKTCLRVFSTAIGLQNHENKCKKLRCYTCNKIYFTQETLDNHECNISSGKDSKIVEVKFSCDQCHKSFKNMDYLKRHKKVHEGQFACSICMKNFKSEEEKTVHFRYCKAFLEIQDEGFAKCEKCTETFATVQNYREHFFIHTHQYKCDRCQRHFVKIGSLHTHNCGNEETTNGEFSCPICLKEFVNVKSLNRHIECHGDYKYFCELCQKRFHRKDVFNDHVCKMADGSSLRIVRQNDQIQVLDKLVCHVCGKAFISSSNLNKHMKIHGEKKCECPVCGKKFHQDEYLKMHIAGVHEKKFRFQCSDCGKVFTSKPGLMCHIKANHASTREVYPCPTCGKIFNQKGNMKTHMYSHMKDRLFQCKFCSKTFKYPDQLIRHKLVHTMENKLKCEHCDRTFVKSYDLNRHYQVTHSGMMYVCEFCNTRCSHRHTVLRHYRRKHPSHADLIKDPEYLKKIYKVVEKDIKQEFVKELSQDTSQILIGETGEIMPQTAAEVLHSLSSGGPGHVANIRTVHVTEDGINIDSNGMMMVPTGTDETFSVQSIQPNSQSIVILQIVNPQDADQIMTEEVQVHELEATQIIETTPLPDVAADAVAEEITAVTSFVQNFGS